MKLFLLLILLAGCRQYSGNSVSDLSKVEQAYTKDGGISLTAEDPNDIFFSDETIADEAYFCGKETDSSKSPYRILKVSINRVEVKAETKSSQWFSFSNLFKKKNSGTHEIAYFILSEKRYKDYKALSKKQKSDIGFIIVSHQTSNAYDLGLTCELQRDRLQNISLLMEFKARDQLQIK